MQEMWKQRGKDDSPQNTVKKIESLLEKAGLSTEYTLYEVSVPPCVSSRVALRGELEPFIGSCGKGFSEDLCKASAYAELIERLQNKMFATFLNKHDISCKELLEVDKATLYEVRGDYQPVAVQNIKQKLMDSVQNLPAFFDKKEHVDELLCAACNTWTPDAFLSSPFYSLREKCYVDLPRDMFRLFTGSNGMAAGNTAQEAITQACCEIFERYSQIQILQDGIVPPTIEQSELAKYPEIMNIIEKIEKAGPYRVIVKDCSLDKGLPVVAGFVVDTNTQMFGAKFASAATMEVALERIFSESLQGAVLQTHVRKNAVDFKQGGAAMQINVWNTIKTGQGAYPSTVFEAEPSYAYKPWKEHPFGENNMDVMKNMLGLLEDMGADVYIEDVSFMGFPAVYVYAAGISEAHPISTFRLKEVKLAGECVGLFRNLDSLRDEDVEKLLMLANLRHSSVLENSMKMMMCMPYSRTMPMAPLDMTFFIALCHLHLGHQKKALTVLRSLCNHMEGFSEEDRAYLITITHYLTALDNGHSKKTVKEVLLALSTPEMVARVMEEFEEPKKTIAKIYPSWDLEDERSRPKDCQYEHVRTLYKTLHRLERENKVAKNVLHSLFEGGDK